MIIQDDPHGARMVVVASYFVLAHQNGDYVASMVAKALE
jgi:hypothetical protein